MEMLVTLLQGGGSSSAAGDCQINAGTGSDMCSSLPRLVDAATS
jgi:hypothetical protein